MLKQQLFTTIANAAAVTPNHKSPFDAELSAWYSELSRQPKMLTANNRTVYTDQSFKEDVPAKSIYSHSLFVRVAAKELRFRGVTFQYSIFDTCYFRKCAFEDCNFVGCRFKDSNFTGSTFANCDFKYAVFDKTQITADLLHDNCPQEENLRLRFARTLRTNFQSLGDPESANKAISAELHATERYLHHSWSARTGYYRTKFPGLKRAGAFFRWIWFKLLDFTWGNGESVLKLLRSVVLFVVFMTVVDVWADAKNTTVSLLWESFWKMPAVLLGVSTPPAYSNGWMATLVSARLVAFSLFMSIIIKRFSRR